MKWCFFSEVMQFPWIFDVMKSPDRSLSWFRFSDGAMNALRFFWCCDARSFFLMLSTARSMFWSRSEVWLMPERFSDARKDFLMWIWFYFADLDLINFKNSWFVRGCDFNALCGSWDDLGLLGWSTRDWRSGTKGVTTIQPGDAYWWVFCLEVNLHRCTTACRRPAWLDLIFF